MSAQVFYSIDGPLDMHPTTGQCRAANLTRLTGFVHGSGRDVRHVLDHYDLDARILCDPENLIATKQLVDVLEHCSATYDDPLFGLRMASFQDADVFGCVTALCRAAPTMRSGIQCLIDYLPVVHAPDCRMQLVEGQETAELAWTVNTDLGLNDQANFQAAMLNVKLLRLMGGEMFRPDWVSLSAEPRRADEDEIERLLGCHTFLRRPYNAIAFPRSALDKRVSSASHVPYQLLSGYFEKLKAAKERSMTVRVEAYVRGSLPTGFCSLERCAENVGLSVRTLQHRLASEGVLFSGLVERERESLSCTYLTSNDMPLDEIAQRLGYGDQTSFGRAFKRWTGITPNDFRRGQRHSR